ncbi:Uncharacterized protein DAT39_020546 [Clarias magur]|uniref:Uncharacterized protein n=1 Tax=Clarias magur TaxID=1594786 RepID=A0A8J4WT08_CLAMG|nr:Uncharacterized protein DAT39_020546 [Clarias magur]
MKSLVRRIDMRFLHHHFGAEARRSKVMGAPRTVKPESNSGPFLMKRSNRYEQVNDVLLSPERKKC